MIRQIRVRAFRCNNGAVSPFYAGFVGNARSVDTATLLQRSRLAAVRDGWLLGSGLGDDRARRSKLRRGHARKHNRVRGELPSSKRGGEDDEADDGTFEDRATFFFGANEERISGRSVFHWSN